MERLSTCGHHSFRHFSRSQRLTSGRARASRLARLLAFPPLPLRKQRRHVAPSHVRPLPNRPRYGRASDRRTARPGRAARADAAPARRPRQLPARRHHRIGFVGRGRAASARLRPRLRARAGRYLARRRRAAPRGRWNASLDAVAQVGGGALTPYVGGSVGANWSTGDEAQSSGARGGLETMAGVQVKLGASDKAPSLKLEERFGYVRGQEHALGTRIGLVLSL